MTTREGAHTAAGQPAEKAQQRSTRPDDDGDQPRRRRRWGRIGLATVVVAALVAGTGWFAWTNGWLDSFTDATEAAPAATGPAATATVEIGTLAATDSWDGTLDHGRPFTVTSNGEGVITRLAEQGATVKRGDELYRINEQPVTLLYGTVPMYRNLAPGDSGADVKQFETHLAKLGFKGFTVDTDYTSATAAAVRAWQADIGATQTGTVARGDVVFAPAGGQVDSLRAGIGDTARPGTPVLDITGTDQVVSLEIDVDDRDRFEVDTKVTVVLPGGDEVAGTVATTAVIEVRAEGTEGEDGDADTDTDTDTESILRVEIAVDKNVPDEFVGATVEVIVAVDERTDVLLVPVNALLAPAGGGYGLEVVADNGSTSIVPVETGLFAGGKVEITSGEVAEGTVVGVAGR